jgi:hypothetical protein
VASGYSARGAHQRPRKPHEINFTHLKQALVDALAPFSETRIALSEKLITLAMRMMASQQRP